MASAVHPWTLRGCRRLGRRLDGGRAGRSSLCNVLLVSSFEECNHAMTVEATGLRTHLCGSLRAAHAGTRVRLGGWVHRTRNLGGLVFVDLRDRAGIVQVSFDPNRSPADAV